MCIILHYNILVTSYHFTMPNITFILVSTEVFRYNVYHSALLYISYFLSLHYAKHNCYPGFGRSFSVQCVPFCTIIFQLLITSLCKNITVTLVSAEAFQYNVYLLYYNILVTYHFTVQKHDCYPGFSRIFSVQCVPFCTIIVYLLIASLSKT